MDIDGRIIEFLILSFLILFRSDSIDSEVEVLVGKVRRKGFVYLGEDTSFETFTVLVVILVVAGHS
jgi:hypothetical protein